MCAGFFQDQAADAKARGEKPKTKDELDKVTLLLASGQNKPFDGLMSVDW